MTLLTSSSVHHATSWLIWLLVILTLLLSQWAAAWYPVRRWINQWEGWLDLAVRLWACRNLAEVIQVLARRQMIRSLGALP